MCVVVFLYLLQEPSSHTVPLLVLSKVLENGMKFCPTRDPHIIRSFFHYFLMTAELTLQHISPSNCSHIYGYIYGILGTADWSRITYCILKQYFCLKLRLIQQNFLDRGQSAHYFVDKWFKALHKIIHLW